MFSKRLPSSEIQLPDPSLPVDRNHGTNRGVADLFVVKEVRAMAGDEYLACLRSFSQTVRQHASSSRMKSYLWFFYAHKRDRTIFRAALKKGNEETQGTQSPVRHAGSQEPPWML